jgi:hypothetical protein
MVRFLFAVMAGLLLFSSPPAHARGFDRVAFDAWVSARAGERGETVYWYSIGTIRRYPSGELLFNMEGFDATRAYTPEKTRPFAHQYNRKIYFFRDAQTNAIIREHNGRAVAPIAYPYQFITYELKGEKLETFVEQGAAPRLQRLGPIDNMSVRRLGNTWAFTAPVFLDLAIPSTNRRIDAFENYDFFIQRGRGVKEQHQLSWMRYGDLPEALGGGKAIYHLITWRMERWNEIPHDLRAYVEANFPQWKDAPKDLAEIRALQTSPRQNEGSF